MRTHAVVEVVHGKLRAEVDEELAPIVLEIWRAGIPTSHSCQDMGENIADVARQAPHLAPLAARLTGRANIGFCELPRLVNFYECLANAGPRDDIYERMMHWASPQAWELVIGVWDWGLEGDLDDVAANNPTSRRRGKRAGAAARRQKGPTLELHPDDRDESRGDRDDGSPLTRISAASFQVRFPRTDISEMTDRMQRHNRGERVSLGTPTWSTLGFAEARRRSSRNRRDQ